MLWLPSFLACTHTGLLAGIRRRWLPGADADQERLEKQKRVLSAMETERRAKQEQKQKTDQERKESAAKCEKAKQELARRQEARYLYRKGTDGGTQVLSDEEREAATAEAEAAIKKWCK